jgi:MFS family permease
MDERDREHRIGRRTGRRMLIGGVVGTALGAALGLLVGAFVVAPWTAAHWAIAFAGAILGGGIALVQGGLAGLEPVNPGAEASGDADPLRDATGWTSVERNERDDESPSEEPREAPGEGPA